ncbi:alpha-N-acetylglucosaminidase [Streptomyces sp. WMMC897]|uniref:alpha-N-acetylglucosaminidase n=1 Tax=Streptomyces sp. WMMC897 TaxID=3014782 RepID=UPI0022B6A2FD|nr:alpha-N-acetylglucosaminidase TIM-barrel domain-containing protein [Streptomyces sp. WMMC897]MCZ7417455.1 alpha-N-acetylglucosaminidase C-terminal domain-containing protein [Streptomyces sp. WMMC897]
MVSRRNGPGEASGPGAPTRRALLGTAGALGAGVALTGSTYGRTPPHGGGEPHGGTGGEPGPGMGGAGLAAARAALERLLPEHAEQFALSPLDGPERFTLGGRAGAVEVGGTSPAVLLTGVHWYLKYTCAAHLSWAGSQVDLPERLPAPRTAEERRATVPHRFALNDTHDGYTGPYADWARWDRLIDLLALHGVNEVLVTPGAEAVYHRLLLDFGYDDAEARAWLPAPSHQPWWLLQNMASFGGPVSPGLLARRTELGRRITGRLRELGMSPVLPGYFGTVPRGFAERNPGARTVPQGTWAGLPRPDWLDPRTEVFREVAAAFYAHQRELFGVPEGEGGLVKMDLLHEGGDPGDVPVPEAARAVERALGAARPGATWVILGWRENPRRELLDGLAHPERMLVVDGLSDLDAVTDREADWGGVPYAFGTIPNFGGRTTLGAKAHRWTERFTRWRDRPGSALRGTAFMPEAAERDPAAFELFSELAWRREPVDRAAWFTGYAAFRYGAVDRAAAKAFGVLRETAYRIGSTDGRPHDSVFAARPSLSARSGTHYATHTPAFDPPAFDAAFAALLDVAEPLRGSDAYRHDVTDLARQAVANRSWLLIGQLERAYEEADRAAFGRLARLWQELMRLADDIAGSHSRFLLGPWLADARRAGGDEAERARLERTARVLLTTWAERGTADGGRLADYANRDWHGLIADHQLPRWRAYLDELEDALAAGRPPREIDWYAREEAWTRRRDTYPQRAVHDAHRTAGRALRVLSRAPYQGSLAVQAEPGTLGPGESAVLTAEFRNENGLRATGAVDLALEGPAEAGPGEGTAWPRVPPGGRVRARWRVTAPEGGPRHPLEPVPYEVSAAYGPRGEPRVRSTAGGTLFVAGPLDGAWRTHSTNGAVFGQLDERYAVDGAGADLWGRTEEFGALYRPAALADGGSAAVTVTAQPDTGPWARAGVLVRNRLGEAGGRGAVNLAVTPGNGVVLSWDADGDGRFGRYRRLTGARAPVRLRLWRAGTRFTGAFSADDGATWRTVASVDVPGAAPRQDAGLFMTAASRRRATVEFADWALG